MFDDLNAHFHENVWEGYQNFVEAKKSIKTGKSRDLRLAINAATALYHLREHIPQHLRKSRAELAKLCPDYNLLGDVVNAAKHRTLTRGDPQVVSAEDIFELVAVNQYKDERGDYFHYEKSVFVRLYDSSERDLYEILTNVLNMWLGELHSLGVIEYVNPIEIEEKRIPLRPSESGAARLDLEIIRGVRFAQNMRLQKYNYETGVSEPIDLTGAEVKARIYQPNYELDVTLKSEQTGKEVTKTISLSEEQSQLFSELESDEERNSFLKNMVEEQDLVSQVVKEYKEQLDHEATSGS